MSESNSNISTEALQSAINQAVAISMAQMLSFMADPNFLEKMQAAFGNQWEETAGRSLVQSLSTTLDSSNPLSRIALLSPEVFPVQGAYSAVNQLIYLSDVFVVENIDNPSAIALVLVEEIGHHIDTLLNTKDSPGDEGKIFTLSVWKQELSEDDLALLQEIDDTFTLTLAGESLILEHSLGSIYYGTSGNDTYIGTSADDTFYGRAGDDSLRGAAGDDLINGDAGNDRLIGDTGSDTMNGGTGDDI
ncbi:MAG TPA: calcium-binding protein, partial [Cyanophyceae cyanobacterium]